MDPNEPVPVYTTTKPGEAEVVRAVLDAEGIDCKVEGPHQGGLAGVLQTRLFVPAKDADRARALLKEHEG